MKFPSCLWDGCTRPAVWIQKTSGWRRTVARYSSPILAQHKPVPLAVLEHRVGAPGLFPRRAYELHPARYSCKTRSRSGHLNSETGNPGFLNQERRKRRSLRSLPSLTVKLAYPASRRDPRSHQSRLLVSRRESDAMAVRGVGPLIRRAVPAQSPSRSGDQRSWRSAPLR